jgi:hypothetical protein
MINQWADIESISCAPDGSATAGGGGSFGYYAVWLALTAGNSNSTDMGSHSVLCISSGQQVLEQFNIRQVRLAIKYSTVTASLNRQYHEIFDLWFFFINQLHLGP